MKPPRPPIWRWALLSLACMPGCGGGGGGGGGQENSTFQVNALSMQEGATWPINQEIVIAFTEPVDFATVSSNTIHIRSLDHVPATGVFLLRDARTVVFQPTCPRRADLSDAGLRPGGVGYVLRVLGANSSPNTVRSAEGARLGLQQTRTFTTPSVPLAFQDTHSGAPLAIVRSQGSMERNASRVEIGGDPERSVYFERDPSEPSQPGVLDGLELPLNLYSDRSTRVAVLLVFDQPVSPLESNLSASRLRLEFRDSGGNWVALDTRVSLDANCTETGAVVRLEPVGVLPRGSPLRAVVLAGFQDIVGEPSLRTESSFAQAGTSNTGFSSLEPPDRLADGIQEGFDFGGDGPRSFQDTSALFDSPVGEWGGGRLAAGFSFQGTGGPNGTFDWVVHTGELVLFDTIRTPVIGGPGGLATGVMNAVNGVVDVRNLIIEAGAEIRVQGPNPMRINATGDVVIRGRLDLSGFSAKNVSTLATGNLVEAGGAGTAGGGQGGNANENTSGPTPRGGRGSGPFHQRGLGGEGGEMGVNSSGAFENLRRPGGGGGGRLAKDWIGTNTASPTFVMQATAGNPGHPGNAVNLGARGALSGLIPALGGRAGEGPFLDANEGNDFFGVRPVSQDGELLELVRGELPSLWAGYGGGGGGNAGKVYPNPGWSFNSDEKGGGGGGGGGALHIKALGKIVFGAGGNILSNGGRGATGENTGFLDHIGGTGGGGSGGHVVLESATGVDFTDGGTQLGIGNKDFILAGGFPLNAGAQGYVNECCRTMSNGGAGGPGLVQIHVPDSLQPPRDGSEADIRVPTPALAVANPLDEVSSPPPYILIPSFGARSKARSKWISIGGADKRPTGPDVQVRFLFDGIETSGEDAGKIRRAGSSVEDRAPLVSDDRLLASNTARILSDGITLELTGSALATLAAGATSGVSNDLYLRTPALLANCVVRMRVVESPSNFEDFPIARAVYDEGSAAPGDEALRMTVGTERGRLDGFNVDQEAGTTGFQLLPRFFQVVTNGLAGSLPTTAFIRIQFEAARDNGFGGPDEGDLLVPWTADITEFNAQPPGELQFFRYEIEFDLDAEGRGVTRDTEPVTLDFLKIPFVF